MNARVVAWRVLRLVNEDGAYANLVAPREIRKARLSRSDAGFATELIYGSLRLRGRYDAIIQVAARRALGNIDEPILDVLRLGAHQALELATPPHAAVNESVGLARSVGLSRASGLVNAVMRRITERSLGEWIESVGLDAKSEAERLSVVQSHPRWIVDELQRALAADGRPDDLETLLVVNNQPASVSLVDLRRLREDRPPALPDTVPDGRTPLSATFTGGDPSVVVTSTDGLVRVQDVGSQIAALMVAEAPLIAGTPDTAWLDVCAGPGGKTALLAALAAARGAVVWANEPTPHRADLVRAAIGHATNVTVTAEDGRQLANARQRFSRVLVDAPCSGLGALRRRPESRWRKSAQDLPGLEALQRELLSAACDYVAPGGILAYVTCTPTLGETRDIVQRVMDGRSEFTQVAVAPIIREVAPGVVDVSDRRLSVQLWPHIHGTDAMFLSLFRRDG